MNNILKKLGIKDESIGRIIEFDSFKNIIHIDHNDMKYNFEVGNGNVDILTDKLWEDRKLILNESSISKSEIEFDIEDDTFKIIDNFEWFTVSEVKNFENEDAVNFDFMGELEKI